ARELRRGSNQLTLVESRPALFAPLAVGPRAVRRNDTDWITGKLLRDSDAVAHRPRIVASGPPFYDREVDVDGSEAAQRFAAAHGGAVDGARCAPGLPGQHRGV